MAKGAVFPAFIRAEYDGKGFADFRADADRSLSATEQRFRQAGDAMSQMLTRAIAGGGGGAAALDIGADGLREAARAAAERAQAAQTLAVAVRRAAEAEGDYSQQARASVAAAEALAVEQRQAAAAALSQAEAAEQVQRQLNRLAVEQGAVSRGHLTLIQGGLGVVRSAGEQRQAMIQVGQQMQDVAVSFAGGMQASTIFAQQLPQLAFAMSGLGGVAGRVGTFFAGPWGVALSLGAIALGPLINGLFESATAAGEADDAGKALADRQADLANFFDLATGAIKEQNQALVQNAILARGDTIESLRAEQSARNRQIRGLVTGSGQPDVTGISGLSAEAGAPAFRVRLGNPDLINALTAARGNQAAIDRALRALAESGSSNADTARTISDLRAQSVQAARDIARLEAESASLDSGELSASLRTPGRSRTRAGGGGRDEAARLASLREAAEDAGRAIASIAEQFDRTPSAIARVNSAMRRLDDIASDIERKRPANAAELVTQLEQARAAVRGSIAADFDERLALGEQELAVTRLRAEGREAEADQLETQFRIMREIGAESVADLDTQLEALGIGRERYQMLLDQRDAMAAQRAEAERLNRLGLSVAARLEQVRGVQASVTEALIDLPRDARGALSGLISNVTRQFDAFMGQGLAERIFGPAFAELEAELNPRLRADRDVAASARNVTTALEALEHSARVASGALAGTAAAGEEGASPDIVVNGKRPLPTFAPGNIYARTIQATLEPLLGKDSPLGRTLGRLGGDALEGGFYGRSAAGLLFGRGGSSAGASIGGALGNVAGKAIGKQFGEQLGKLAGLAGPLGSIVGGVLGSALGGVLKRTRTGVATIGGDASGRLSVASYSGNSRAFREQAGRGGDSVVASIERIAEQFGARVNSSAGSVSIGIRDGRYRVDTTGRGNTRTRRGAIDFGEDAEAAVRAATLDLIRDGVIAGLRASTQRLLQAGKDLEGAVQRALDFESVFSRLKAYRDPVGAALDNLDREFTRLRRIFEDASATTAEFAELEALYGIERARAVREAAERTSAPLRNLFDELTSGNDARSLRERLAFSQARYAPLAERVRAGDTMAYEDFAAAARELLDLQRQISGSQAGYFDVLDEVTALTRTRLDAESNAAALSANRDSPFASATTLNPANDNAAVIDAIASNQREQTQALLAGLQDLGSGLAAALVEQAMRLHSPSDYRTAPGI